MRRPRAVRFLRSHLSDTVAAGCVSLSLRLRSFTAVLQIPPYAKARREYFSSNLQNIPLGQSRVIPAPWRFPSVGCLFTPQIAVCAIVKNVADAIFNRGLQLICLCTMSAPRVFSANLQNAPLGQSRAIPASWRFPSVGCLFAPRVAVCAIVKKCRRL